MHEALSFVEHDHLDLSIYIYLQILDIYTRRLIFGHMVVTIYIIRQTDGNWTSSSQ